MNQKKLMQGKYKTTLKLIGPSNMKGSEKDNSKKSGINEKNWYRLSQKNKASKMKTFQKKSRKRKF